MARIRGQMQPATAVPPFISIMIHEQTATAEACHRAQEMQQITMPAMRTTIVLALILIATVSFAATPATMRVDYYHTGDEKSEFFSLDQVSIEPLPWPGNPRHPIDDSNLGKYFFEV